jgi:small subunit ribosomal protein S9
MADEPTEHTDEEHPDGHKQVEVTEPTADTPSDKETPTEAVEETSEQPAETDAAPVAEQPAEEQPAAIEEPGVEEAGVEEGVEEPVAERSSADEPAVEEPEDEEPTPRVKPSVPGAHLEVDIVPEGVDPLAPEQPADPYAIADDDEPKSEDVESSQLSEPISSAAIDLAAGARYKATGKRKTAIARVILKPGSGTYLVNGRTLDEHFPRVTLQRNIRQPLETVGYQDRMDVVARLHGGGISAQAGALRHGISRALLEADPNLRGELKRRGFLTRDSRAKERKKAGLKKARKRPQFSKR